MIEFRCPDCDHFLRIPDEYAGKQGKCKYCRTRFTVPDGAFVPDPTEPTRGEPASPEPPPAIRMPDSDDLSMGTGFDALGSNEPSIFDIDDTASAPRYQPRPVISGPADGILGTTWGGYHFSLWLMPVGLVLGLFGAPIGGAILSGAVVYYILFARDVPESSIFNKFTAPVWAWLAFVSIPLSIVASLIQTLSGESYIDSIRNAQFEFEQAMEMSAQAIQNPESFTTENGDLILPTLERPEDTRPRSGMDNLILLVINLAMTGAAATVGNVFSWVGIAIGILIAIALMSPFYLLKLLSQAIGGDAGGIVIYVFLMLCTGTIGFWLIGYLYLLATYWLGRRLLDIWGHNSDWGLAWRGFIYRDE